MKNKICIGIITVFVLAVMILTIYNQFYRIDMSSLTIGYSGGEFDSPDDKYQMRMVIWLKEEDDSVAYIMGTLVTKVYLAENHTLISDKNSKVIFWNRVNSSEYITYTIADNVNSNGKDVTDNFMDVEWLDEQTIRIEDITLNVKKEVFDYRRNSASIISANEGKGTS